MKKFAFWCSLFIVVYFIIEGIFLGALLVSRKLQILSYLPVRSKTITPKQTAKIQELLNGRERYLTYSAALGWTVKPNEVGTRYHSNAQGIRSNREYTFAPAPHMTRIVTFGDSFTHCDGVHNHDTWQEVLNRLDERLEVINFGVPAFGMDQAFLRFQHDGSIYQSHIVLIGFMTENIFRHVNRYRPFYSPKTGLPLSKPRFIIEHQALKLIDNPIATREGYRDLLTQPAKRLPQFGINDFFYQHKYHQGYFDFLPSIRYIKAASYQFLPQGGRSKILYKDTYREDSEAYNVTIRLFDAFIEKVKYRNMTPIIVIFPDKRDVVTYWHNRQKSYTSLFKHFNQKGYRYIDIMDAFELAAPAKRLKNLFKGGHYSPRGNQRVAQIMLEYLQAQQLIR
ncbi:SGNH/GDSL hydrolase family protein [Candidatus Entotheonella palauensis]|uniref:SGNH hydrolase-type esterase domain-containing protein n=1 Tax=Candidatus Entotheonella gemina TaxID=1429439 RepID=W4MF99_9BACT|nr:hypothetical protein [Candidatus Entotheonella palauensis]ETX08307.1 MAG: hypothetical protein ETSY2_06135 [Candidatus Entotheonella gemina]